MQNRASSILERNNEETPGMDKHDPIKMLRRLADPAIRPVHAAVVHPTVRSMLLAVVVGEGNTGSKLLAGSRSATREREGKIVTEVSK